MTNLAVRAPRADSYIDRLLWRPAERKEGPARGEFEEVLGDRTAAPDQLAPVSLADQLFAYLAPRQSTAQVLASRRYVGILEELAALYATEAVDADEVGRLGALLLRNELRKHRMLREHCNGLIES